jgi:hypothetical protein
LRGSGVREPARRTTRARRLIGIWIVRAQWTSFTRNGLGRSGEIADIARQARGLAKGRLVGARLTCGANTRARQRVISATWTVETDSLSLRSNVVTCAANGAVSRSDATNLLTDRANGTWEARIESRGISKVTSRARTAHHRTQDASGRASGTHGAEAAAWKGLIVAGNA